MLHKSLLGEHAVHFPCDEEGHIPEPGDHWSKMKFQLGPNSPFEEGISHAEKTKRTEYLDREWWPKVLERVAIGKARLDGLPEGNPIQHWRQEVMTDPDNPSGFTVD
jgi:hypothetical protein